jgi:H+/Cl- antiporter ClcA/CBS domain-containing protein
LADGERRWLERRRLLKTCCLAVIVGLFGAGAALLLQAAISLATNIFFYGSFSLAPVAPTAEHLGLVIVFIPVVGGVIVGIIARYGSSAIRGHGIPETMQTILVARSRIAPRVALLKPLATAISIGSGGPFGAEGPIIQTGGALGSLLGQLLRLTAAERKILLAAGAAAGMAATFGAPVAAVFLVVELLLFEFRARSLLPVALASAVAAASRWGVLGSGPLFPGKVLHELTSSDLPCFALLGLCGGLMAVFVSRIIYVVEDVFDRLPIHWMWWPALGGLAVGVVGGVFPEALGVGANHLTYMVAGKATAAFLLFMLISKTIAWSIALGSGTSGGVLGPLLLIGGSLGGSLAFLADGILPAQLDPGLWTTVGMAAVFAGATRTPLTSVVFAVELTHNSGALLPLLIACSVSDLVSLGLLKHSLMTEKIARRGIPITHDYELDALASQTVAAVMTPHVETVHVSLPVRRLYGLFHGREPAIKHQGYPVVDDAGRLVGMVTRSDLPEPAWRNDLEWLVVADIMNAPPIVSRPDEPLREAAERMLRAGVGRLPVVAGETPQRLVGLLSRSDVLRALARRAEEEQSRELVPIDEAA